MGRRREGSTYGPSKGEGGDGGEEGGDQGLLRALKSHRDGLKDSEARTRELEEDVEGWGEPAVDVRHAAEVIEVCGGEESEGAPSLCPYT